MPPRTGAPVHSEGEGSVLDVAPDMSSGSSFVACRVSVEGGGWATCGGTYSYKALTANI